MPIIRRRGWEIPEHQATDESHFLNRRRLLLGAAGLGATLGAGALALDLPMGGPTEASAADDPLAALLPARRNEAFKLDRDLTPEKINGGYNNFYEFGTSK